MNINIFSIIIWGIVGIFWLVRPIQDDIDKKYFKLIFFLMWLALMSSLIVLV